VTISAEFDRDLVSVIIPVYNGESFLSRALGSVFEQDYRSLEVIVVDDGSSDSTARIVQDWPEVRYFYQRNQGHGSAKNTGIKNSHGEYLAFLDVDDWWSPRKLQLQVDFLKAHPQVGYAMCYAKYVLERGATSLPGLKPELLQQPSPAFLPSALVVRRTTLCAVGIFDPAYIVGNDSDWFFRAQDLGIPRMILPEVLLYRSIHGKNESNRVDSLRQDMLGLIRASIHRKRWSNNSAV
jgi:glycosyltransferase involved in cell wall biosynthesis